jgi:hypothetical protein
MTGKNGSLHEPVPTFVSALQGSKIKQVELQSTHCVPVPHLECKEEACSVLITAGFGTGSIITM